MSAWGKIAVGGFSRFSVTSTPSSTTASQAAATSSADDGRERLRAASAAMVAAFLELTAESRPAYLSSVHRMAAAPVLLRGIGARLDPIIGATSRLQTTRKINTQESTARSSTSALGLDLSGPAASVLRSTTLGLDTTSATGPSRLGSSSSLGLDLTSPAAASSLSSSSTLGLDLTSPDRASVLSSSATLGLDTTTAERASTITSTGEMYTGPTTLYSTSTLEFDGAGAASTSDGTLTGTYTGVGTAANATSLTVKLTRTTALLNGLLPSRVSFEVRDQTNAVLFSFDGNLRANNTVYLGDDIGLTISFSGGRLTNGQTASTEVSHILPSVDASATFNDATPRRRPQFDSGAQIIAGSFTVNGTTIAVNADDTINAVLARITASAAGVTATLAGDRITLTTKTSSEDAIVLGGDTSGFLAATKLSAATTTHGNVRDDHQVLSKTSQLSAVTSGSFTINGVAIAVDRDTDGIASILSRITGANAGVTAAYDSAADRIVLTRTANGPVLIVVGDDDSGFLSAVTLATDDTERGHLAEDMVALLNLAGFQAVTSGAFDVDGHMISVDAATDTVQTIVDRINQSGARVVASYDAESDRIVLDATYESEDEIVLGGDTSGFLDAAHLSSVNTVRGNLRDDQQVLAKASQFAGVTSGSFTVNGVAIDVDVDLDSVSSILDRINDTGAGVTARLDAATNTIQLVGLADGEDLIAVGDDTTGFLAAAKLDAANTVRGNLRDDEQALGKTTQFGGLSSGTFTIGGATIDIDVDTDSVTTLVDRINGANAGVTASYDETLGQLVLTGATASEDVISVTGDSTGLAAAIGWLPGNTLRGNISDDEQMLARTSPFAGVASGTFAVNGATIAVDVDEDSLNDVIARINAAGAGVTAAYDAGTEALVFTPDAAGQTLFLGDDTSGLLAAARVAEGAAGAHVNADAAFNGTGLESPLFDPGTAVRAGSFTVNGVTIVVADDDSVNSVLDRITASNAGVSAAYDDASQTVRLTTKTGSDQPIVVADDTSGFLAAVKLDGSAESTTGGATVSAFDAPIGEMAEYATVAAGAVTVNGRRIAVDPAATSVRDLISAIDAVDGVTATLDGATGAVTIAPDRTTGRLDLADTSGALALLGVAPGRYQGRAAIERVIATPSGSEFHSNAAAVAASIEAAAHALNEALSQFGGSLAAGTASRRDVEASLGSALLSMSASGLDGLRLAGTRSGLSVSVDGNALKQSLTQNAKAIHDALSDPSTLAGSLGALIDRFAPTASSAQASAFRPARLSRADLEAKLGTSSLGMDMATRLLFIRAVLRAHGPDMTGQAQAARAYADVESAFERFRG